MKISRHDKQTQIWPFLVGIVLIIGVLLVVKQCGFNPSASASKVSKMSSLNACHFFGQWQSHRQNDLELAITLQPDMIYRYRGLPPHDGLNGSGTWSIQNGAMIWSMPSGGLDRNVIAHAMLDNTLTRLETFDLIEQDGSNTHVIRQADDRPDASTGCQS